MKIEDLYEYPLVGNTTGLPYYPNKPLKQWVMPANDVPVGTDLDNDFYVGRHAVLAADGFAVTTPQFLMTYRQAVTLNCPAIGDSSISNKVQPATVAAAPIPLDLSNLPAGAKLVGTGPLEAFEGGNQINIQLPSADRAAAPAGTDPTLVRILQGVQELLADRNLPAT